MFCWRVFGFVYLLIAPHCCSSKPEQSCCDTLFICVVFCACVRAYQTNPTNERFRDNFSDFSITDFGMCLVLISFVLLMRWLYVSLPHSLSLRLIGFVFICCRYSDTINKLRQQSISTIAKFHFHIICQVSHRATLFLSH